jgi:hypothetical protein
LEVVIRIGAEQTKAADPFRKRPFGDRQAIPTAPGGPPADDEPMTISDAKTADQTAGSDSAAAAAEEEPAAAEEPADDNDEIDAAFRWKTMFTEFAARGSSGVSYFLANIPPNGLLQRDLERLMEAHLARLDAATQTRLEKAAVDCLKTIDDHAVGQLQAALRYADRSDESDSAVAAFWKLHPTRLPIVRAVAVELGLDPTTPVDTLRILVFHKSRVDCYGGGCYGYTGATGATGAIGPTGLIGPTGPIGPYVGGRNGGTTGPYC